MRIVYIDDDDSLCKMLQWWKYSVILIQYQETETLFE